MIRAIGDGMLAVWQALDLQPNSYLQSVLRPTFRFVLGVREVIRVVIYLGSTGGTGKLKEEGPISKS